ncbi:hypothetical protein AVEN_227770-1 [Araneus ventricosus]|uniref:Uncharacterized protein n=1 Tax=Araneus ventricosus TaxID=182803 RepID=A0A4Y2IXB6_ARAVE|nr:hypothetical protein AVEN_227770-1 [Araneus ventricosus]
MENSSYLFCNSIPWQATSPCDLVKYKDEMLAVSRASAIIHQRAPKKLTEEAAYIIYVMLAFFGLAALGTSITAYEFFFKDNEKKSAPRKNPYNEKIAKSTLKALEESKSSASHGNSLF